MQIGCSFVKILARRVGDNHLLIQCRASFRCGIHMLFCFQCVMDIAFVGANGHCNSASHSVCHFCFFAIGACAAVIVELVA